MLRNDDKIFFMGYKKALLDIQNYLKNKDQKILNEIIKEIDERRARLDAK